MILTPLIAIAFGSFGTGANGNNYYNNYLYLSSGLVTVAVAKNTTTYSAVQVKCDVVANCDFRETTNEQGNKEYYVHFNSWECDLKTYNISNDTFTSVFHSNAYNNYFESSLVNEPNNNLEMSWYLSQTSNNGTLTFSTRWYDSYTDETSGLTVSYSNPIYGTNAFVKFPNSMVISFDLDNLQNQLTNAFNMANGGYNTGYEVGYGVGSSEGFASGYESGYADGFASGVETDETAFTIFNGILTIGMIPINVFLAMFDFTVLGINISNFVMSLLTVLVTIWVIRVITGSGGNENS